MTAKRILVPLDGSDTAEAAAEVAADLARSSGGSIRLLQVSPVPEKRIGTAGRVVAYADQECPPARVHEPATVLTTERLSSFCCCPCVMPSIGS